MPTYTFANTKTGKEYTKSMSMAELDIYLTKNKDVIQLLTSINIVGGVAGITHKVDNGWKENMARIAEAHPNSALADRYGKKTIKEIRTKQVLEKHRSRKKNGRR